MIKSLIWNNDMNDNTCYTKNRNDIYKLNILVSTQMTVSGPWWKRGWGLKVVGVSLRVEYFHSTEPLRSE